MLQVIELRKTYSPKKGATVKALDGVTIDFGETGMVFLLGKSGSGKSTLLNVLGGLDRADSGDIIIKGKSSKDFSQSDFDSYRNTFIGFVFQEYNILNEFNVEKNIALALELQGKKATHNEVLDILEQVDLVGYEKRKPNELSGGQKQRIAIARALIKNPEIIFADEPTGALDSHTGAQVFETLKKLSQTKLVIVVSHDREFAELYGDRIVQLKDGKVIEDIYKNKIPPTSVSSGISVIGNDLIHIKKGHKLTVEEESKIINCLRHSTDDVVISINDKRNVDIKKASHIDDTGNLEKFDETKEKDIKIKNYNGADLKLIKSRLRFKDSLKMGASSLKVKPVRLFFTILLCFVAFTLFGLADVVTAYKYEKAAVSSINEYGFKSFSIVKTEKVDEHYNKRVLAKQSDIDYVKNQTGLDVKGVRELPIDIPIGSALAGSFSNSSNWPYYDSLNIEGLINYTEKEIRDMGFTIVGSLPEAGSLTKVAITNFLYETIKVAGLNYFEDGEVKALKNISSPNDIIGKEVKLDEYTTIEISGVIETGTNDERYQELKGQNERSFSTILLTQEIVNNTFHRLIYCSEELIEYVCSGSGSDTIGSNCYISVSSPSSQHYFSNDHLIYSNQNVNPNIQIKYFDSSKASLGANDTVILFNEYYVEPYKLSELSDEQLTEEWNKAVLAGYTLSKEDYFYGLQNYCWESNSYAGCKSGKELAKDVITQQNSKAYYNSDIDVEIQNGNSYHYPKLNVVGVGFVPSGFSNGYDYSGIVVPKSVYQLIKGDGTPNYSYLIGSMSSSSDAVNKVVSFHRRQVKDGNYFVKNEVLSTMDNFDSTLVVMSKVFLYAGIALAIFASLMMLNFIATSISYKKREIGILRAVGARSSDVFGIFFKESLIIALVNFILATIATMVLCVVLNGVFAKDMGLMITVFNFTFRQIALLIGVSIGVAFVSSFLPVYKIASKKPIDAINNK